MEFWAHRGCSFKYPENTLKAFEEALEYDIRGIELDVQLTRDGVPMVFHDEKVDRVTNGKGYLKDYWFKDLRQLKILATDGTEYMIPTLTEVLNLLEGPMKERGLTLNIELKNSEVHYEGLEKIVLAMVKERGLEEHVVYSSFSFESLKLLKELDENADIAILHKSVSECIKRANKLGVKSIHPYVRNVRKKTDLNKRGFTVRCWNTGRHEPFHGQTNMIDYIDPQDLEKKGVNVYMTNIPERYTYRKD